MIDIDKVKPLIVERLKPLRPNKIILFGSYANGKANEESDIDIFLLKDDLKLDETRLYQREARKKLLDLRDKYKINSIDILSAPTNYIENREDYFYKIDVLKNGKVWYESK